MRCQRITAFESDEGLNVIDFIRESLPENGELEPEILLEVLKRDSQNAPPDIEMAGVHTSVMALAELMLKSVDRAVKSLDNEEDWNTEERKFCLIISFTTSKETVHWTRNYIFDTLRTIKKHAESQTGDGAKWGGWSEEENWTDWQERMEELVGRLDIILGPPEAEIELIPLQRPEHQEMENSREVELSLQSQLGLQDIIGDVDGRESADRYDFKLQTGQAVDKSMH